MKNKDLKKFYDKVYRGGEKKHYTKILFEKEEIPLEEREVLESISWGRKSVLDVGCGTGLLCREIVKRGARRVVGIDFSKEAIAAAKKKGESSTLEYHVEDLADHTGEYDVVVSLGTLEHMDDPYAALKRMKRLLKKGGTLIITSPNWTNPRGYVLQTLWQLFGIAITLADIHYLTPIEFENWAKKLSMSIRWTTFDFDWGHGEKFVKDMKRRLPLVFKSAKMPMDSKKIDSFVSWLDEHVTTLDHTSKFSGALGLYKFKKK